MPKGERNMGIRGIIFMLAALCGLLINYFPKKTAAIFLRVREADYKCILKIKIAGLVIVFAAILLLMLLGK